jgi:capsular exopolysaccharide synthesis family protein
MKLGKNKKNLNAFDRSDIRKILKADSPFAVKEAYNTVRTNLLFTNKGNTSPVYIITSPLPNDGKSINCLNLAISFAQMGKRTLIIDFDMRNPTIHNLLTLPLEHGASELLAGLETTVTFKETSIDNLTVLTAGKKPPNPAELLTSDRVGKLIELAQEHYDFIFIDTPPIEVVADAAILSKIITGYVLVIRCGDTDMSVVKHAVATLEQVQGNIVGFMLNDVDPKSNSLHRRYNYSYNYKYYKYSGYHAYGYGGNEASNNDR